MCIDVGSSSGGLRFARSTDHGATFSVTRIDNPKGQGRLIAAQPFIGPNGEVYVAWNDYAANTIAFNGSLDGGATLGTPSVISSRHLSDYVRSAVRGPQRKPSIIIHSFSEWST